MADGSADPVTAAARAEFVRVARSLWLIPEIIPPEIQVTSFYPGADANTLEQSVTTPLEQQISGVDNMDYMSSTSAKVSSNGTDAVGCGSTTLPSNSPRTS